MDGETKTTKAAGWGKQARGKIGSCVKKWNAISVLRKEQDAVVLSKACGLVS